MDFSYLPSVLLLSLLLGSAVLSTRGEETPSRRGLEQGSYIERIILWGAKQNISCLDGSKPGYYLRHGYGSGLSKWIIYFEGGGWCFNEKECRNRMKLREGSSNKRPYPSPQLGINASVALGYGSGILSPFKVKNPEFYNWNVVSVMYCDGGAFAGSRGKYISKKKIVYYLSGALNLDAILEDITLYHNFKRATRALLVGCSAGGQATTYACDKVSSIIGVEKTRCLMDGGFFPDLPTINGGYEFRRRAQSAYYLHGMSKGVVEECFADNPSNPWKCFFAQYNLPYVKTPFLIVQSVRDPTGLRIVFTRTKLSKQFTQCLNSKTFSRCTARQKKSLSTHFRQFRTLLLNSVTTSTNRGNQLSLFLMDSVNHCISINSMWESVSSCKQGRSSACVRTGVTLKEALKKWAA